MSVTKEFAVKIDTELSDLYEKIYYIKFGIYTDQDNLKWYKANDQRIAQYGSTIAEYEAKIAKAKESLVPLFARQDVLNKIYFADPWTRAYLVVSSDGHVHSSMDCSTCFNATRYRWLVEYSNDEETTIVEDAGELACTICYPSAPAETLNRPTRIVIKEKVEKEKARVERQEKKDAKEAKRKASAPNADGSELVILYEDTRTIDWKTRATETYVKSHYFATERTAVSEYYGNLWTIANRQESLAKGTYYDGQTYKASDIALFEADIAKAEYFNWTIARALAGKHGVTIEEEIATLEKKYAKRKN
jgi:hypothetical protein